VVGLHHDSLVGGSDLKHLSAEHQTAPKLLSQHPTHGTVVHDPGSRNVKGLQAAGVRLDVQEFLSTDESALHSVGTTALVKLVEPTDLTGISRHNNLATQFVGYVVLLTELQESFPSSPTVERLGRTGLVIDTGMNNPRVPPGLMKSQPLLFLQDRDLNIAIG